jgi:hypothetical protein
MPIKSCNKRCSGCALTRGAVANLEPDNYITANLAVMGPFPFYCHAHIDYSTLKPGKMSREEFREREMVLCTGWLEEVKKLAATGYYSENAMVTKVFAKLADENLAIFLQSDDPDDKKEASEILYRLLKELSDKRKRFQTGVTR